MGKSDPRANLRVTRAQMNNAATSAQARAFKARQLAKQQRENEERKLRKALAAAQADAGKGADGATDASAEAQDPSSTATDDETARSAHR